MKRAGTAIRSGVLSALGLGHDLGGGVGSGVGSTVRRPSGIDAEAPLASVGMSHRAGHRPSELSGGERRRVGIVRALVNEPSLLLVDEPTAALDRRRSHEVVQLLADRAHDSAVAVVMVTHDRDVLEHCDSVLEMVDGRLGTPALVA